MVDDLINSETSAPTSSEVDGLLENYVEKEHANKIAQAAYAKGAKKAAADAEARYQQQLELERRNMAANQASTEPQAAPAPAINTDELYQQFEQRFEQKMSQAQMQRDIENMANSFISKMEAGQKRYQDWKEVTDVFNPAEFPEIVQAVHNMDNASDIIYELVKNPSKLTTMSTLAQRSPSMARAKLLEIANAVKTNDEAMSTAQAHKTNAPLSSMQPSRISNQNNGGGTSVRDFRGQF